MSAIIKPFTWLFYQVYEFLYGVIQATGIFNRGTEFVLAVILLPILVRLLVLPLNIKQMRSTMKMQEIQPELQKLQSKYKNDPQKLQEKTMQLYKDNNVSMFGGCLPMLIQLPILWALYYVFMRIDGLQGTSFLWIKDLSKPDNLYILPILSAVTTYISSLIMTKSQPQQGAAATSMSTMNIVMSLMMGFFAINFQSMLVLYWVVGNLIQMVQTYFIYVVPAKKKAAEKEALEGNNQKSNSNDNQKKSNKKIKNK